MLPPGIFTDLFDLVFPSICITCGNRLVTQEKWICFDCWTDLPVTNFHLFPENKVAQLFWGRVNLENATALFSYRKGSRYQNLLHAIKYRGCKELGYEAGRRLGFALTSAENYHHIDMIIPVPLHPGKLKKRGYNQSEWIARGMASCFEKEVSVNNLVRTSYSSTQTRKNRYERWKNVEQIFDVLRPELFSGKHLLLIDDVVTTGATLEACANRLLQINGCAVSVAALAFAEL